MWDTYIESNKRKSGAQQRVFAKPENKGNDSELSKLCTNCQAIFQGQLALSNGKDDEDNDEKTPYKLYGDGSAHWALDCHLCLLRLRNLITTGIDSESVDLDLLTTRYRIEHGKKRDDFFSLSFSYSLVQPSEELLDSSKDVLSGSFWLSPVFDPEAMAPERSVFDEPTLSAKNLSLQHFVPCTIETEERVATYHRRATIVDRGLWAKYQSMIQSNPDYVFGSSSLDSPSTWAIPKLWIENCIGRHERCGMARVANARLPTRLVHTGAGPGIRPRLVDGAHLPESTPYVTLSHRWGDQKFLTLTTRTKDIFYRSVPAGALSPTFKDAMAAALRLGYHYIWIDSLCIVQDSTDDWAAESKRMGEYYSNSTCNLAASAASEAGGGGCFAERNPLAAQPCIVRETWTNTSPQLSFYVHDSIDQFGAAVFGCELGTRGWVIQETLLAPRTLYFGHDQVFWDCLGHRACEAYPALWIGQSYLNKLGRMTEDMYPNNCVLENRLHKFLRWETLVQEYSSCSLTFPEKDKLVALSGIAKAFGDPADYLAGLWPDNLGILLLWEPANGATRHKSFIAPSWSWASINGGVEFNNIWDDKKLDFQARQLHGSFGRVLWDTRKKARAVLAKAGLLRVRSIATPFVTFVSAKMEPAGDDATGRVTGGSIRVKGFLFRLEDLPPQLDMLEMVRSRHPREMRLSWDEKFEGMGADADVDVSLCRFLPIRIRNVDTLSGLVLQRTSDVAGEYRRVGLFGVREVQVKGLSLESLAWVRKFLKRHLRPLEQDDYVEKTGGSKDGFEECIISIV